MDCDLVGVWQNRNDAREYWTVRADGTLRWLYQGVPLLGIPDSIVEYTYRADPAKSPAHLDLIHQGVMGTSSFIYELTRDELRIGITPDNSAAGTRARAFGPKDRYYRRVPAEPG